MTYAQIDDGFDDSPKYADYGAAEMGLIACAITYANRNLTDGRIPQVWPGRRFGKVGSRTARVLVENKTWSRNDDGSFQIVGFLDHNKSREEVLARREADRLRKSENGAKGGVKSAATRRTVQPEPSPESKRNPDAIPGGIASASEALSSPLLSSPNQTNKQGAGAPSALETELQGNINHVAVHGTLPVRTGLTLEAPLTDRLREIAEGLAMTTGRLDIDDQWGRFKAHYVSEGKTSCDWSALWSGWLRKAGAIARQDRDRDQSRGVAGNRSQAGAPQKSPPSVPEVQHPPPDPKLLAAVQERLAAASRAELPDALRATLDADAERGADVLFEVSEAS